MRRVKLGRHLAARETRLAPCGGRESRLAPCVKLGWHLAAAVKVGWHLAAAVALGVLAAAPATAQEAPAESAAPVYVHRLEMPVAGDALLSADSVTADLVTGEIFVTDSRTDRIVIFDAQGAFRQQIPGGTAFSAPRDLAVDADGRLVVLANRDHRTALLELDFDGRFLREIELTGLPDDAAPPNPVSLALSPAGDRIYVVDGANLRLWIVSRESGAVLASADLGRGAETERQRRDRFLGRVDVYGDRVMVAVPSEGEIWLYDLDGERRGWVGARGTARCELAAPDAAAVDAAGNVVVLDQQKMMMETWVASGNRCTGEYYGIGNAPGYLYFPSDLALDARGLVYVTQGYEGRVQVYRGLGPAAETAETAAAREAWQRLTAPDGP